MVARRNSSLFILIFIAHLKLRHRSAYAHLYNTITIINKTAELSQRRPLDAPNIWVP